MDRVDGSPCIQRVDGTNCPPPSGGPTPPPSKTVTIGALAHALSEIQAWAGAVQRALEQLPAGMTVKVPPAKKSGKKKAGKKAKKKAGKKAKKKVKSDPAWT